MTSDVDSFVEEAYDDYIGLWQIVDLAEERESDDKEIKIATFAVVEGLLDRGLLVGSLTKDGGFKAWDEQDPSHVINRIYLEWQALGHNLQ